MLRAFELGIVPWTTTGARAHSAAPSKARRTAGIRTSASSTLMIGARVNVLAVNLRYRRQGHEGGRRGVEQSAEAAEAGAAHGASQLIAVLCRLRQR